MSETAVLHLAQEAIMVTLTVAAPLLLASLLIGTLVSLIQVATSIQDVTLTFVPKIIAVSLMLLLAGPWMIRTLVEFTARTFAGVAGAVG